MASQRRLRNHVGEIELDAKGQTSRPDVFAGGSCTTLPYKPVVIPAEEAAAAQRAWRASLVTVVGIFPAHGFQGFFL